MGRKKLDDRSRVLVYLGTEPGSKAYRLLDPSRKRIVVSRDVIFDETKEWSWNDAEKTEYGGGGEIIVRIKAGANPEVIDIDEEEDENPAVESDETVIENEEEGDEEEDNEAQPQLRRSQRTTSRPSYLDDYVILVEEESERLLMIINDEPWSFNDAKEMDVWIDACRDEIFSIEKNDTWDLVELPEGVKPIGLKWVFKIKRNADGSVSKYKARLVAKSYVQRHGVDFDEVFAPVARMETTTDHCTSG